MVLTLVNGVVFDRQPAQAVADGEISNQTYADLGLNTKGKIDIEANVSEDDPRFENTKGLDNPVGASDDALTTLVDSRELGVHFQRVDDRYAKQVHEMGGGFNVPSHSNEKSRTANSFSHDVHAEVNLIKPNAKGSNLDAAGAPSFTVSLNHEVYGKDQQVYTTLGILDKNLKQIGGTGGYWGAFSYNGGKDHWMNQLTPWGKEGWLQIASGDFNSDGIDEVAVYIPEFNRPRIEIWGFNVALAANGKSVSQATIVKQKTLQLAEFWNPSLATGYNTDAMWLTPQVSLTVGDLDKDGGDDLIATASVSNDHWNSTWDGKNTVNSARGGRVSYLYVADHDHLGSMAWDGGSTSLTNTFELKSAKNIHYGDTELTSPSVYALSPGVGIGDIDADGMEELVVAGHTAISGRPADGESYMISTVEYNTANLSDSSKPKYLMGEGWSLFHRYTQAQGSQFAIQHDPGYGVFSTVSVAVADLDGTMASGALSPDAIFVEGAIMRYAARPIPQTASQGAGLYSVWQDHTGSGGAYSGYGTHYIFQNQVALNSSVDVNESIGDVVVANFTANPANAEQIYYTYVKRVANDNRLTYALGYYAGADKTNIGDYYRVNTGSHVKTSFMDLWAPDVDGDGIRLRMIGTTRTYTEPILKSVLVAAPYIDDMRAHEDYEPMAANETAWGVYDSEEEAWTAGGSAKAGVYVGGKAEVSFLGLWDGVEIEGGVEIGAEFTYEARQAEEMTVGVTYTGKADRNYAVVSCLPVTNYFYRQYIPATTATEDFPREIALDTDGDGEPNGAPHAYKAGEQIPAHYEVMTLTLPNEEIWTMLPAEKYDAVAAHTNGLDVIQGNMVSSKPGDIHSYRSELIPSEFAYDGKSYIGAAKGAGNWQTTGSRVTAEVSRSVSNSNTYDISAYLNFEFSADFGGFKTGASAEASGSYGWEDAWSHEERFAGTVDGLPDEIDGEDSPYAFEWLFGVRHQPVERHGKTAEPVRVLDYLVRNATDVPYAATSLRAGEVTNDSIELIWNIPNQKYPASGYEVQRKRPQDTDWVQIA
ncbi:MAG: hypothetical protein LBO20_03560, partial [Bifidobacteriaceae bacterium]|nr:hypothetical protein [Bifidobacteriaceae bacterium]